MKCSQVRPLLSFLIEKETGPLETLEIRRHLDGCSACLARVARLDNTMSQVASLPQAAPPADIAASVMSRLRNLRTSAVALGHPDASLFHSAKWSGLAVLSGIGLASLTAAFIPALRALGRPLAGLAGLFTDGQAVQQAREFAGAVVPMAMRALNGDTGLELSASTGLDVVISVKLLATALGLASMLAIPVAVLTIILLRGGGGPRPPA